MDEEIALNLVCQVGDAAAQKLDALSALPVKKKREEVNDGLLLLL